jgi:hypothetical protein
MIFQSLDNCRFKRCIFGQIRETVVNYMQNKKNKTMGLKQKIKSMIQNCSICSKTKSKKEETKA